ncbi:hypothetical protein [uncultured Microbulbifer sp.]|uniref:hypothetical protein n=1 Tax=uncultured Microbulbifer sp. TaxID=348147 RepID=UPI00263987E5|nr:hypothetical protein [uncultured Microbulbifer sp.]
MDILKKLSIVAFTVLFALGMAACEKQSGAEEAGEKVDDTVTEMGNAVEDACEDVKEKAGAEDQDC